VIAIGDLHGDVRALGAIARACELVDEEGSWSGGEAHVVLMGDLLGGPRSRLLLGAIMRLEREAMRNGGRIHTLLGNHDVLPIAGRIGKMSKKERATYGECDLRTGALATWIRGRPTMLKIGDSLFVHAGVDRWALDVDPAEINAGVRAWIAYEQGVGEKPPKKTRWMIEEDGPLFTRAFRASAEGKDGPPRKVLRAILEKVGATRVVLGHSPTKGAGIVLEHPHYGSSVVLVDTEISDDENGKLAALVIRADSLSATYALDRSAGRALEQREERAMKTREEEAPRGSAKKKTPSKRPPPPIEEPEVEPMHVVTAEPEAEIIPPPPSSTEPQLEESEPEIVAPPPALAQRPGFIGRAVAVFVRFFAWLRARLS
jgi:hypothetical protein